MQPLPPLQWFSPVNRSTAEHPSTGMPGTISADRITNDGSMSGQLQHGPNEGVHAHWVPDAGVLLIARANHPARQLFSRRHLARSVGRP